MSLTVSARRPRSLALAPELTRRLSVRALRKLARLVDIAEDLTALSDGAQARQSEARTQLSEATERLRILEEEAQNGRRGYRGPALAIAPGRTDDGEVVVVRQSVKGNSQLEELRNEVATLNGEWTRREAAGKAVWGRMQGALRPLEALRAYLSGPASGIDLPDVPLPVVKRGDLLAQLEAARKAVEELGHELDATRRAPATDEEVLEGLGQVVAGLAARGRPDTTQAAQGNVRWPDSRFDVFTHAAGGRGGTAIVPDALAVAAWMDPAALLKRLDAEALQVRRETGVKSGLSRGERQQALETLAVQILNAERLEEALIDAMGAAALSAPRRTNADPRAVLGIIGPANAI
jgi:hypothetical protein